MLDIEPVNHEVILENLNVVRSQYMDPTTIGEIWFNSIIMIYVNCSSIPSSEAATIGVLWKKVFLEISQNSQENTCARVSLLIKLQALGLRPATLLEKRLWHSCFPVNFMKFLITPFSQNTSGRLLLQFSSY